MPPAPADATLPELCVVVPTFNERDNVRPLLLELTAALEGIAWEAIFVDDDSPDGTARAVREIDIHRSRVRCLERIGRRGLAAACTEGMLASSAPYLAVMDADLQHDPRILPRMLALLRSGAAELVVGSRYAAGGSTAQWNPWRRALSRLATRLGRTVAPAGLHDPMSGYFMLRRALLEEVVGNLSGVGFKILLDILASARRPVVFREVPYVFRRRHAGESKLDARVAWECLLWLADKLLGPWVPARFVAFAAVGAAGVVAQLAVVSVAYRVLAVPFVIAQTAAAAIGIVCNYWANTMLTYHDRRRRGARWLAGLASFALACSIGAVVNVSVAVYLLGRHVPWALAALGGIAAGAVWNYAVSSVYTWDTPKRVKAQ